MTQNVGETIEEIHVADCKNITDESIEAILNSSKAIKFLMFHSCPKVTGMIFILPPVRPLIKDAFSAKKVKNFFGIP